MNQENKEETLSRDNDYVRALLFDPSDYKCTKVLSNHAGYMAFALNCYVLALLELDSNAMQ